MKFAHRFFNFWLGPVDPIRLDTFRVILGTSMLLYYAEWWQRAEEWLTTKSYHVSAQINWSQPTPPPLPAEALPFFGVVFFGSLILWILGVRTRLCCWVQLTCSLYVLYADILSAYTINKLFVVTLSILAFVPHGTYWSLEKTEPRPQSVWPIRILQTTLVAHYFIAGLAKILHGDWLKNPDTLWSHVQGLYRTDAAAWLLNHLPQSAWAWMQYSALSLELLAPLIFCCRSLQPIGFVWGLCFQTIIALTMNQLIYFSLQILSFYLLFMNESNLHTMRMLMNHYAQGLEKNLRFLEDQLEGRKDLFS